MKSPWNLTFASIALLLCACAVNGAASEAEPAAGTQAAPAAVADDYLIGPGDTFVIDVYQEPGLSRSVTVRPDGKITSQLVENMVAIGKTPSQLGRDIETVLAEYLKAPKVTVIMTQWASVYSKVNTSGQVRQLVSIPYREGLTVRDVVQAAGGLTEFASPNKSFISRTIDGKTVKLPVKLGKLLDKGDEKQNLQMKPGDTLVVPKSIF
ncbi:MAG: polysaccharide biosynthesis/export family protein [Steroidobacteraceae bacterium]